MCNDPFLEEVTWFWKESVDLVKIDLNLSNSVLYPSEDEIPI